MIKTLIFDFNGTMFFDAKFQKQAWRLFLQRTFNHMMTESEFQQVIAGRNNRYTLDYFAGRPVTLTELKQWSTEKESLYQQLCLQAGTAFKLAPGLPQFLDDCQQAGLAVNIATASERENMLFFFEHLELARWFDFDRVILNNGQFPSKPAPDMFLAAMAKVHGAPATSVVFEDSLAGIQAAMNAQAKVIVLVSEETQALPVALELSQSATVKITDYNHFNETVMKQPW